MWKHREVECMVTLVCYKPIIDKYVCFVWSISLNWTCQFTQHIVLSSWSCFELDSEFRIAWLSWPYCFHVSWLHVSWRLLATSVAAEWWVWTLWSSLCRGPTPHLRPEVNRRKRDASWCKNTFNRNVEEKEREGTHYTVKKCFLLRRQCLRLVTLSHLPFEFFFGFTFSDVCK